MPVTNIKSTWSSGNLVFFEGAVGRSTTGDVLTIGTTAVTVGNTAQDVDLKIWLGSTQYVLFDASTHTVDFSTVDISISGDLVVTAEQISLADDLDMEFGTGTDVLMRFSTADESDNAFVIALDNTSQQMHITDKGAVATDWTRSAGTHPEIAIHSNTTPITDYLAIGNHDGTTAYIDVVGGTTLQLNIAGAGEVTLTASAFSPYASGGNALGTTTLMWANLFLAASGVINFNNGNVTLTHSTGLLTLGGGGLTVGASGAGFDVIFYGDTAGCDFFFDQNGDTDGALILGADTKGVDFKAFGLTTGNYLIWDKSADDLLLVGTATQLAVAGTTASTNTTTGSLRTAGGLGVAGDAYIGSRLDVTATSVHATTGRVGKFTGTVVAPNQGDGYGVFEVDITASGTFAGTTNASSTWLNVAASAVPGGNLICVHNDGIYLPAGITASSAKMIMGSRMQYVADDGANPGSLFLWSTNIFDNVLTALIDVNALVDMGGSTGAVSTNAYKIPLFKDASANKVWYVNIYDG